MEGIGQGNKQGAKQNVSKIKGETGGAESKLRGKGSGERRVSKGIIGEYEKDKETGQSGKESEGKGWMKGTRKWEEARMQEKERAGETGQRKR